MDFVKFFTREEHIAGLEIDSGSLRLVLLKRGKSGKTASAGSLPELAWAVEEKLEPGVVEAGAIVNEPAFKKALVNLKKKTIGFNRFVILSLPAMGSYTHLYFFPHSMERVKIFEAIKLNVDFQLPMTPDKIYWDWEEIIDEKKKMALLVTGERDRIDKYIELFHSVGWSIVATEFHNVSFMRACKSFGQDHGLLVDCRADEINITAVKNNTFYLSRFIPAKAVGKLPDQEKEIEGVLQYFQAEIGEPVKKIYFFGDKAVKWFTPKTVFSNSQLVGVEEMFDASFFSDKKYLPSVWAVAVGAGKRGAIPRDQDKFVSLMPMGTERAYEQQKALAFVDFVSILTTAVAFLLIFLYVSAYVMMSYLQQINISKLSSLSAISLPFGMVEQEKRAENFNTLVREASTLVRQIPRWSLVVEEIKKQAPTGVDIAGLSMSSPEGVINITGVVLSRSLLNSFKNNLESSAIFMNINIPLSHIGQKANIPFNATMNLRDPQSIYFH